MSSGDRWRQAAENTPGQRPARYGARAPREGAVSKRRSVKVVAQDGRVVQRLVPDQAERLAAEGVGILVRERGVTTELRLGPTASVVRSSLDGL